MIHISQLLHGAKAIKVLGYVDAAAIKMLAGNVRILNKEFQNTNDSLPMTEDCGGAKVMGSDIIVLE